MAPEVEGAHTAIFKVLGVANRTQAALAARSVGVVFAS